MVLAGRTAEVIRDDRRSGFGTECGWTIDCTLKYDECEPVICDPFCGSGCLSRAVLCNLPFVSLVCLTVCDDGVLLGACAELRSECRNASIPSCKYAVYVTVVSELRF